MKLKLRGAIAPVCLMLAGCTGDTNPLTANVFDNARNLSSGEYQNQIDSRQAQAQAIINSNNATQGRISSLEAQRAANASAITSLRGEVAAVRADIASARARVASDPAKTAQLARLETQVSALQSDATSGGDPNVARTELARIRSAVRALS